MRIHDTEWMYRLLDADLQKNARKFPEYLEAYLTVQEKRILDKLGKKREDEFGMRVL